MSVEKAKTQFNKILTLANGQYNIYSRKFEKIYYNIIFLSIVIYAIHIFADEYKKIRIRRKVLMTQKTVFRRRIYFVTLIESLQIVTNTLLLDL